MRRLHINAILLIAIGTTSIADGQTPHADTQAVSLLARSARKLQEIQTLRAAGVMEQGWNGINSSGTYRRTFTLQFARPNFARVDVRVIPDSVSTTPTVDRNSYPARLLYGFSRPYM